MKDGAKMLPKKTQPWMFILIMLTIVAFVPMYKQGIMCNDELQTRFWSSCGFAEFIEHYFSFKLQGRALQAPVLPLMMWLGLITQNNMVFRLAQIATIILCILTFTCLTYKVFANKKLSILCCVNSFFRALSSWVGYKSTSIEFDVQERVEGESKWSVKSLISYAVNNITSFSAVPMQFVTVLGVFTLLITFVVGIQTLVRFLTGNAVQGFTTVILLILLMSSILMISLGIIGYYLSKMFDELKGRPKYLVQEIVGRNEENE